MRNSLSNQEDPVKRVHFLKAFMMHCRSLTAEQRWCGVDSCGTEETMLYYILYTRKLYRRSFACRVFWSIHTSHPFDKQLCSLSHRKHRYQAYFNQRRNSSKPWSVRVDKYIYRRYFTPRFIPPSHMNMLEKKCRKEREEGIGGGVRGGVISGKGYTLLFLPKSVLWMACQC